MRDLADLLTATKILPTYLLRKNTQLDALPPWSVELHPTSSCNYACVHCSYGRRNRAHKTLAEDVALRLARDLTSSCKPKGIFLSGGGEPLAFPLLRQLFACFTKNGIKTALISNGALLREDDSPLFRDAGYIAISVYSTEEEEYRKITGGNNFAKQFAMPALLGKAANPDLQVGARCVLNNINYKNILNIYDRAMDAGFDYIIFIPAVDYEGSKVGLDDGARDFLMSLFANSSDFDARRTNIQSLVNKEFSYYSTRQIDLRAQTGCDCVHIRSNAFVNYDGGVYTCQPHIGREEYCLGNLYENDFSEIWNSPRHREVIDRLDRDWNAGLCKNCRCISYNLEIASFSAAPDNVPLALVKDCFL